MLENDWYCYMLVFRRHDESASMMVITPYIFSAFLSVWFVFFYVGYSISSTGGEPFYGMIGKMCPLHNSRRNKILKTYSLCFPLHNTVDVLYFIFSRAVSRYSSVVSCRRGGGV